MEIVCNELAILSNSNLKYLSAKKDTYEHAISYFAIGNVYFYKIVKAIPENLKMPYWKCKEINYRLKVKSKILGRRTTNKISINDNIKTYEYNESTGYHVTNLALA